MSLLDAILLLAVLIGWVFYVREARLADSWRARYLDRREQWTSSMRAAARDRGWEWGE